MRGTFLHRWFGDGILSPLLWQPERQSFAVGLAVGALFAMIPMPFQMIAASVVCFLTRVNIPAALVGTWISNPFTMPLFVFLQYRLGCLVLGRPWLWEEGTSAMTILTSFPVPLLVGGVLSGLLAALIAYPLTLGGWDLVVGRMEALRRKKSSLEQTS